MRQETGCLIDTRTFYWTLTITRQQVSYNHWQLDRQRSSLGIVRAGAVSKQYHKNYAKQIKGDPSMPQSIGSRYADYQVVAYPDAGNWFCLEQEERNTGQLFPQQETGQA